ncbi:MAG: BNR-4 repeat-containing protein [Frankiaceae bacterium]|nr:BNR-4 repeat-containing protein [Frankiaceae bacterium]
MQTTSRVAAVVALAVLAGLAPAASADPVPSSSPTTQIASDAAWCWFSEPRAVQSGGVTFLGWITSAGDVTIGSFESQSGNARRFVLMTDFQVDDHDHPAVLLRPDGRLQAFWSAHNGGELHTRTSVRPRDISAWGPLGTVPVKAPGDRVSTYANPIVLPAERNRLYVFARSGYEHVTFTSSDDMGRSWSPAHVLVAEPGQRPYVKYADDGRGTIAMAFTNGHPAETHSSIYYAAYRAGAVRRTGGQPVAATAQLPIAPRQADLVFASPADRDAWVHDVAFDASGRPRIVFATMPQRGTGPHDYWYAAWTGSAWLARRITDAGHSISDDPREPAYTAGISLDHDDPAVVVLARPGTAKLEIERWRTGDLGKSWTHEAITSASVDDNVRPVIPRGSTGSVIWMAGHYGYFTSFRTAAATNSMVMPHAPLPSSVNARVTVRDATVSITASLASLFVLAVPGKELTLQARPVHWKTWQRVGLATSNNGGVASFRVRKRPGWEYRVVWPGDHSMMRAESQPVAG